VVDSLRFVLILLLTLALDLSTPMPPLHGASEAEELEESLHAQAGRRSVRPVREIVVKAAVAHERRVGESLRPRRITTAQPRQAAVTIRKLPPSFAEPSPLSDDH
jgi:hypothetical protein